MSERRPYHREQPHDWWAHKPYLGYTIRELSGVAVALYGGVLLAGLISLQRGPEAFDAYRRFLTSPLSLLLHLGLLAAMLWHVITWFQTMPKTMPKVIVTGVQVPQQRLVMLGWLAAAGCSVALLAGAMVVGALS